MTDQSNLQNEELSLLDIIHFFTKNFVFLGVVTTGLSVVAIAFLMTRPSLYQKQITLSVRPIPVTLSTLPPAHNLGDPVASGSTLINPDPERTGNLAITLLKNSNSGSTTLTPRYNPTTQTIEVSLQAKNSEALGSSSLVTGLQSEFQQVLSQAIQINLSTLTLQLQRSRQIQNNLEQNLTQLPASNSARQQALEQERAHIATTIAAFETDQKFLQKAEKQLPEFVSQVIQIQVLAESPIRQTHVSIVLVLVAIAGSFFAAIPIVLLRNHFSKR